MLKNKIRKLLLQGGVDPSLSGYEYLLTSIELCYEDNALIQNMTKNLYYAVGRIHNTKNTNVERCMRHAIEKMKQTECSWFCKEVIGLMENKWVLTNSQFIAICVEILKMQEVENAE